jgi:uncharacterized membrane protein YjgN (DUF898 family)
MSTHQAYKFKFTGDGADYFRIWITNIVLSVLTLGIYSAWAKVRTSRWLYGHTILDGQAFGYHATPMQLLKGRLIAIVLFGTFFLASHFFPLASLVMLVTLFFVTPWLVLSHFKFNARMSSYRGIRFDFTGQIKEAIIIYVLLPLLLPFTLGFIWPYINYRQTKFFVENSRYGDIQFGYSAEPGPFWLLYFKFIFMVLVCFGALFIFTFAAGILGANPSILAFSTIVLMYFSFMVPVFYYLARMMNLFFNPTTVGPVSFKSTVASFGLLRLFLSNLFLMFITLGLFYPWAKVRNSRYRADHLIASSSQNLADFTGQQAKPMGSTGSEMADVLDFGPGFL